jgi:hypothetical protein
MAVSTSDFTLFYLFQDALPTRIGQQLGDVCNFAMLVVEVQYNRIKLWTIGTLFSL